VYQFSTAAFTVWQLLWEQYCSRTEWRLPMYFIADDFLDATRPSEELQQRAPKQGASVEAKRPITDKHEPRPPFVEDNMATCG
jgi:hypothetical protein